MAIIKKFSPKENLNTFSTFVTDTNPNSDYFRITEFKETFTGGRNGFLIEGSEHLKETTEIKIEILDVNGDTLYFEPGDGRPYEYYEGLSTLIAVYVYNDTPIGQAKITVLGELKTYLEGGVVRDIPDDWKGVYNAKWERTFKVNKLLANEDRVRFYRRPKVKIEEIVKPIFNTSIPTVVQSGSVNGIPNVPLQNQTLENYSQPTSYRLEIVGDGAWTGSVIGTTLEFGGIGYSPTVVDIINSKNIIVNPPYSVNNIVNSFTNEDYTASFQHIEGIENGDSPLFGSFAKINITELKTFVGDVARVKVFRKSKSSIGDFEFVQEIQLESNEILVDLGVVGKNEEFYGLFTDINIDEYWITSSNDITTTFNQSYLYNSAKLDSNVGVQNFYTSNSLSIQEGVEYTLSFGVRSGLVSSPNYIQAFITGSRQSTTLNGSPVTIQVRKDIVKINSEPFTLQKQDISRNFIAEKIDDAKLYFEVVGTDWYINNVSLRASQETSFSPDEITFIQPVPKTLQVETFDYKFEFYDINNNTIPVTVLKTERFVGGNTALLNRSLDVEPTNLFFTFDSASQSVGVDVINFEIIRNLLTGSVTFTSGAFDSSNTLIPSIGYVGQYPGLLTSVSDTSATLTAANFTGSDATYTVQYIIYTASCEDLTDTVTIGRVSAGAKGEDGEAGVNYVIKSFNGTFIRNFEDDKKIELQAYRIDGSQIAELGSGDVYKLFVVSESVYIPISVASSSGFLQDVEVGNSGSGDIDYNAKFGRDAISGSLIVYLRSGSVQYDSTILIDVLDGLGGGKFEATTEVFVKRFDDTFTPTSSSITASFFERGDVSNPITASLIVYPSHSFDLSDNDVNHLYYETGSIDNRIELIVKDVNGVPFESGKDNASVSNVVELDFIFTDRVGEVTNISRTLNISTDGELGTSPITVEVTPSTFVFIADESGNILNYDDLTTTISVYEGTTQLPLSISPAPGFFTGSTFTPTNITISDISEGAMNITVGQFSNITGNSANVVYNLVAYPTQTSIYKTDSINVSFTQNLSVVKGGRNSRSVNLSADTYIVVYDGDDNIVFPPSETVQLQAQALNHTGSVYYQFLKNNVTQSQFELQSTYELNSGVDIVEAGETDVWSVRTREGLSGPVVAVDSISIAGVKSGKDSRSVSLVASSNFVNYDGTGSESPSNQEIVLTATPINHTGTVLYEFKSGSTTIQSGSVNTYIISSSYTQSVAPNIPVKPLFNETQIYSVLTRENSLANSILSADAITIAGIKAGTDSEEYAIIPLNGTAIKNSDPTAVLEIKATYQGQNLTSGDYKLAILSASLYEPLSAASASGFIVGVNSGSIAGIDYNATFTSQSISGSLNVFLVSGSSLVGVEDSITLADISDGLGGGFVEASTLTFIRDKNNTYTPTTSSVTASFYQRGTVTNPFTASLIVHPIFDGFDKMKYVTASVSPFIEIQVDDQDGSLVQNGDESTTKDLNFIFKFVDPTSGQVTSVTETFFIISDGIDGEAGLNAKVVQLSADSFVVSYDENSVTPTPTSILLIASSSNFISGSFRFTGDGITEPSYTLGVTNNTDTASISVPLNYFPTPKTYRVGVSENDNPTVEIASDTITIFAVKPGLPGTPGDSAIEYKIVPLSGSQIRNGDGTLELQLVQISGSVLTEVTSGDYKLASGSVTESILSVGNGYTNGGYGVEYNPIISAEAISGSLIIYVITGSSGAEVIWDTITLTDITDGLGGGSFLSSTLGMRRTASLNEFQPQFISATASFFDVGQGGLEYTSSFRIFPSYSVAQDVDFMKFETGLLHPSISLSFNDGDGLVMNNNVFASTKDLVAIATFTSPKTGQTTTTTETYYIISDGIDGADAYTIVLTNESHTLPADNAGGVSSYAGSGTRIIAYKGSTKLTGSLSTPTSGFYSASVSNQSGITATQPYTIGNNEIVYVDHNNMTAPSASIEYTIFLEGTVLEVSKLQSFAKSVAGASGSAGLNAKLLDISVSSPAFSFDDVSDDDATPLFITASIKQQNLSSAVLTSDISITGSDNSNITVPSLSGTITSGTGTQTFIISFADSGAGGLSGDKGKLPLTINVVKDGILETTTILKLEGGADAGPQYYIKPLTGTTMKNGNDTLIVQASEILPSGESNITSGPIKLFSGSLSGSQLASLPGFGGSTNYFVSASSAAITGRLLLELKDEVTNTVYDTEVLLDQYDGLGGGSIFANSLLMIRDKNNIYTPNQLRATASFFGVNVQEYNADFRIEPNFNTGTLNDEMKFVTGVLHPSISLSFNNGDGGSMVNNSFTQTKDVVVIATFTDPSSGAVVTETQTFYISSDGKDGLDGLQVYVVNQIEEVQCNSAGTPNEGTGPYTNTGTDIYVTEGTSSLQYTTSTPSNGEWTVASTTVVPNNITVGSINDGGEYAVVGNHTSMSADSVNINYNISGKRINGQSFAITGSQRVYKAFAGATGAPGTPGTPGSNGADAYTINISNEAVTLPTTVAGIVSPSGSGTTISVFRGSTELNSVNTAPPRGINEFSASIFSISPHITPGTVDISGNEAIFGEIQNWSPSTTSSGSIVYKIDISEPNITVYKTQSFALSYEGETGPGIVFRGFWTGSINYQYDIDSRRRDAVLYDTGSTGEGVITYYATLQPSGPAPNQITPTGSVSSSQYWEELGVEDFFVAAKIAIFEESFVKNTINVGNNPGNDKANIIIQGSGSLPYIAIGQTGSVIGYEQPGIFMGVDVTDKDIQRFSIANNDNSNYLKWDGDNLKIKGNIEFGSSAPGQNIIQLDWKYKEAPIDSSAYRNVDFIYGSASENAISYSLDPFGNRSLTWDCYSGDDANDTGNVNAFDGGFNTALFPIDSGSSYKYVVYVKPTNTTGFPLFGTTGYSSTSTPTGVLSGSSGIAQLNPYFRGFVEPFTIPNEQTGSWQVLIGYVHSNSTPNTELTYGKFKGGAYSVETGNKLLELQDYKWGTNAKYSNLRIFHYADLVEPGIQMQIWGPAVYKIDGTEPSDATLIDKAKAIADGKYSGGTFISADTIFSPTIAGIDGRFSGSVVVGATGNGITLDGFGNRIYIGSGNYNSSDTPFYVASGSNTDFSLGDKLTFNGSTLNVNGIINATLGTIGGFTIGQNTLNSSGSKIELDGVNNEINVTDNTGNERVRINTDTVLPNPNISNFGTLYLTSSNHSIDWETGDNAGGTSFATCTSASLGIFSPTATATYTINWPFTQTPNVRVEVCGYGAYAETGLTLILEEATSGNRIATSNRHSIFAESSINNGYILTGIDEATFTRYYGPHEAKVRCLSSRTFNLNAPLTNTQTYCVKVIKDGQARNDDVYTNPDNNVSPFTSCVISTTNSNSPDGSYSGTPTFTIMNGGGFQSTVACGKYLRVSGLSNPATEVRGGLSVDGIYQNTGSAFGVGINGISFSGISDTTPSFSLTKSFINFQMGASPVIHRQVNAPSLCQKSAGIYCIEFTCPMSTANYGIIATATTCVSQNTIVSICRQGTGYFELRVTDTANTVVNQGCVTAMVLG